MSEALLLPYQGRWIHDDAQVKLCEKSRRIGLSYGEAADDALLASAEKEAGGMDVWYIGYNQDMAQEFVRDVAMWSRAYNLACDEVEEGIFDDEDGQKQILTYVIRFNSGFRVTALSSRPSNLRGKQGKVVIDEAAFHDDLPGLIKAAMALLIWGGRVVIISTHDGEDNYFNELIKEIRAGKKPYSLHTITFQEALKEGLYKRICKVKKLQWSPKAEQAWSDSVYDFYGDDAAEELDVIPSAGGGTYMPRYLIERCQDVAAPHIRYSAKDKFVTDPDRISKVKEWIKDNLQPVLDNLPNVRHVFGQDFGRSGDLSVIWVLSQQSSDRWETGLTLDLRNIPFDCQRFILFHIIDHLPLFFHGKLDARGNGQSHAEAAMQKYGEQYIDCVMLTGPWYNEYFPKYKSAYEGQAITVPHSEDMVADHRRVHLVKGQPRMDDKRDKGEDGLYRHGDSAVAGVLAWAATTEEGEPGAGATSENNDLREAYQPTRGIGRSIRRLFSRRR